MSEHSCLARLPHLLSRWLGYRDTPPPKRSKYEIYAWSFIGTFCGIAVLQAVFGHLHYFIKRGIPPIIASYGAGAVLIYGAIDAPLAQPLCLVGGQFLGALIGVCVTKLFGLVLPKEGLYQELLWLSGSLACASSVVIMQVTGTTHPPGGATALLAVISPEVRILGWYYIPIILLSSSLALAVALILNNIRRCYPTYWLQPPPPVVPPEPGADRIEIVQEKDKGGSGGGYWY